MRLEYLTAARLAERETALMSLPALLARTGAMEGPYRRRSGMRFRRWLRRVYRNCWSIL